MSGNIEGNPMGGEVLDRKLDNVAMVIMRVRWRLTSLEPPAREPG